MAVDAARPEPSVLPIAKRLAVVPALRMRNEAEQADEAIYAKAEEFQPATLRQIYYGLVSGGVIEKTEEAYHLVGRQLVKLRKAGDLPFGWIADNTRWQRKPNTYSDLETMLRRISRIRSAPAMGQSRCLC